VLMPVGYGDLFAHWMPGCACPVKPDPIKADDTIAKIGIGTTDDWKPRRLVINSAIAHHDPPCMGNLVRKIVVAAIVHNEGYKSCQRIHPGVPNNPAGNSRAWCGKMDIFFRNNLQFSHRKSFVLKPIVSHIGVMCPSPSLTTAHNEGCTDYIRRVIGESGQRYRIWRRFHSLERTPLCTHPRQGLRLMSNCEAVSGCVTWIVRLFCMIHSVGLVVQPKRPRPCHAVWCRTGIQASRSRRIVRRSQVTYVLSDRQSRSMTVTIASSVER